MNEEVASHVVEMEIEKLKLKSSEEDLVELIESPVWEDIKAIVCVFLGWEVAQLIEEEIEDVPKTQGRCLVLREIMERINDNVLILAQRNNSDEQPEE